MHDNETGLYIYDNHMMRGRWLADDARNLWIVPPADVATEIDGPDGATLDALNAACRENGGACRMPSSRRSD